MRNQPHGKGVALDLRHGERDAVDRDAALVDEVAPATVRRADLQVDVGTSALDHLDRALAIDVACDEVAAHLASEGEAALEVHERAWGERREIREAHGLLQEIELHGAFADAHDRETAAVHGNAVAECGAFEHRLCREAQAPGFLPAGEGQHFSGFFDDSCEHGERGCAAHLSFTRMMEVSPLRETSNTYSERVGSDSMAARRSTACV
ncbi:hypothetical protein GALL_535980 [mine drainage metagenome]|uniref:Uncharacterized protein n=1 Tax=mine drainage metagenome TaxID=410659 RepID=A0A1J5PHU8_9ZZZZ